MTLFVPCHFLLSCTASDTFVLSQTDIRNEAFQCFFSSPCGSWNASEGGKNEGVVGIRFVNTDDMCTLCDTATWCTNFIQ